MAEKILVVDDEEAIVEFVDINLRRAGYEVVRATTGHEAVLAVRETSPDLVVLDVMLPDQDGFATCREIRHFSSVPVIMLTARGEDRDKISGLEIGADAYLVKPFRGNDLLEAIRAALEPLEVP